MPKISISLSDELLSFVDEQGENRSRVIAGILQEHRRNRLRQALDRAYADYARLCAEDDQGWWVDWERAALLDEEA